MTGKKSKINSITPKTETTNIDLKKSKRKIKAQTKELRHFYPFQMKRHPKNN